MTDLSKRIITEIRAVPAGRVASYGQIAFYAGSPGGARQVARLLHSSSQKHGLPWHRIVGSDGRIRLSPGAGFEEQLTLLQAEGVELHISRDGMAARVDMARYAHVPPRGSASSCTPPPDG